MTTISSTLVEEARTELDELARANLQQAARYPGDRPDRQPLHTVYGGAQLFRAETAQRLGEVALAAVAQYAPDAFALAAVLRLPGHDRLPSSDADRRALEARFASDPRGLRAEDPARWLPLAVHERMLAKLHREPVEDFRIDFEDGFGVRSDAEEDELAVRAAHEVARGMREELLPPFIGIRIKALNEELKLRAVRTLDLFVTTLVKESGALPSNFVITLPKVTVPEQASTLVRLFDRLEDRLDLESGSLKVELMIELTQTIMDVEGRSPIPRLIAACEGRCTGVHFGTYDYTASCNIAAAWQAMDHPASQFALQMIKNAVAGTGVFLSDGATNVLPVGVHRAEPGATVTDAEARENIESVHAAWRLMYAHVRGSLQNGFYQGWDLHPAQIPIRYAASYAFFLESFDAAAVRLRTFVEKAAQATLVGDVFDDAASGQGLLNYFLRGLSSGAISPEELEMTGLSVEEVQRRSFLRIVAGRAGVAKPAVEATEADRR